MVDRNCFDAMSLYVVTVVLLPWKRCECRELANVDRQFRRLELEAMTIADRDVFVEDDNRFWGL
jgi:hypothetical protein